VAAAPFGSAAQAREIPVVVVVVADRDDDA